MATDYGALEKIMAGLIAFKGLPQGRAQKGQKIDLLVSLFGRLPSQPYSIEVLECDDNAMVMRSSEIGAGVKHWHHTLTVTPTPQGCCLADRIEIDAGVLTPLFAMWAKYLYRARHKPRLKMLESGEF